MGKKFTIILGSCFFIVGGVCFYLYKTGYWTPEKVAIRKLESAQVPITVEQARFSVAQGDAETLNLLGDARVNFNDPKATNDTGDTLLHSALKEKDWETFDTLISHGADPDALDGKGLPVTSHLVESGKMERASQLFSAGANIDIPHSSGELALIHYLRARNEKKVAALLSHKADPETVSSQGESALYLSLKEKLPDTRKVLLDQGANPNALSPRKTPVFTDFCHILPTLRYSKDEEKAAVINFLEKGVDLNAVDEKGWRPIQWLIHHRRGELVECLLEKEANVENTLWVAIEQRDYLMMSRLLALKADPNQPNAAGTTPLMAMIHENRADMVKELLLKGVDPQQMGSEGQSALFTAIALKHSDSALALLRNPSKAAQHSRIMEEPVSSEYRSLFGGQGLFDWYCRNCSGLTPLMAAVMRKELAVAEQLIANGADKVQGTTSRYKVFPIQMAAKNEDVKMQQLLIGVSYKEEDQVRKFIIDLSEQKVRYYNNGELKKTSRISSGQYGFRTPPGSYVITDKTRHKRSNIYDGASMPYFQRFSCGAIGFHYGITSSRYASHGCIRLPMSIAKYFWGQTSLGDRVEIVK